MESTRLVNFVVAPAKSSTLDPAATEIVLTYKKSFKTSAARWPKGSALVAQFEKSADKVAKDDAPCVRVRTSEGGQSLVLGFEKSASAFLLHSLLRKYVGQVFADVQQRTLTLDLRALDLTDAKRCMEALATLAVLTPWKPEVFGKKAKEAAPKAVALECKVLSKVNARDVKTITHKGIVLGNAINRVRTLSELPANVLRPGEYRKKVQSFAKAEGLSCSVLDMAALKKKGAGAFIAVVQADPDTESCIVHLTAKPKSAKKPKKKIAFVGKGLCFDTGGYNVKTGDYMNGMHRDMTGSAVAFALLAAARDLFPGCEVHAFLALAENLISPTAYKADEVVTACNGMSIEVVNTDAEGRMALSDTLAIASEIKPDLIVDFATLTGSAVRALDTRRSAVFSNQPKLARLAVDCGDSSGERVWSFPIGEDYKEPLKSKVADILQCSLSRNADQIYAATFLSEFVGENIPWVHMDLSSCENKGGLGLVDTEVTGFGVRWATEFVQNFAK
ncbi:MAG: leucyl aminopeptidase family protein [Bdellovibrionales bacterium]|nr:leucyl aminopeptidase family protein [Bdellovibrionales bacterium]